MSSDIRYQPIKTPLKGGFRNQMPFYFNLMAQRTKSDGNSISARSPGETLLAGRIVLLPRLLAASYSLMLSNVYLAPPFLQTRALRLSRRMITTSNVMMPPNIFLASPPEGGLDLVTNRQGLVLSEPPPTGFFLSPLPREGTAYSY
jgi:hypothetical protein